MTRLGLAPYFLFLAVLLALVASISLACTKATPTPVIVANTPQPTVTASPTAVQTASPVQTSAPRFVTVRGDWNCREYANTAADVLAYVHNGDLVEVLQTSGGWTLVRIANGIAPCWIAGY